MKKCRALEVKTEERMLHRALGIPDPQWEDQAEVVADIVADADSKAEALAELWNRLDWPFEAKVYWTFHIGFLYGCDKGKREIAGALAELSSLLKDTLEELDQQGG